MPDDDAILDAVIDAHAQWLRLKIEPAWRPAIRQSLTALTAAMAAVDAAPLPDDAEAAPIFTPRADVTPRGPSCEPFFRNRR